MAPLLNSIYVGAALFTLQILLQFGVGWRLDLGSLLIGLLLGVLLSLALRRVWSLLYRWRCRISDRLQRSLAWARTGTEIRFRSETAEYVQRHHLGKAWAHLDQIFSPPQLLVPPREYEQSDETDRGASFMNYLWPELVANIATPLPPRINLRELLLNGRRTIVSAASGAGKTTLLAYGAYQCATANEDGPDEALLAMLPVFVHLAELEAVFAPPSESRSEMDPAAPLVDALRARSTPLTSSGIKDMLSRKLQTGQVLLLLDGWNELVPTSWTQAREWLGRLLVKFPKIRVVVAAPLTGYGSLLELEFTLTGLLPWRAGQAEKFAMQWTEALPLDQPLSLKQFWRPGQSTLENSLRLWLSAASGEGNGRSGDSMRRTIAIMDSSLALFGVDSIEKPMNSDLAETTRMCWQRLAFTLIAEDKLSLSKAEVQAVLQQELAEIDAADGANMSQLQDSVAKSGLFITWANGRTGFLSNMWRDFLAACHMAEQHQGDIAASYLYQRHRADLLRFYVGKAGATELANELLGSEEQNLTRDSLFQVASWMPEAPDSGEWQRQTMILLGRIIRQAASSNVLRRRAVAALTQSCESGVLTFLLQLLERSDPFLRQLGTAALPHLGVESAIEPLTRMMKDSDPLVRRTGVYSLAWLNDPATEHPLLMALIGTDHPMSRTAAEGLAQNGANGVEILYEAIEDEDLNVRRSGIHGLSQLDDLGIKQLLAEIERNDPEWLVRSAATEGLELASARAKGRQWLPLLVGKQSWLIRHATETKRGVPDGEATLSILTQLLAEASQSQTRVAAAASLGQLAAQDAWSALETAMFGDKDDQVRQAAFTAMCQIHRAYGPNLPTAAHPPPTSQRLD